ncbi:hypothetical protein BGZ46_001639 [Entomortierella lignicola]|nr:hypothetical protein BGZ46_001639 [Entomortierella lignicola]
MSASSDPSTQTASDLGDGPLMTKSSPASSNTPKQPSSSLSKRSHKQHRHDDRANWVNGKRPKGYRTPEGKEAAEKSKLYTSGTTIPHLVHSCNTYEGVLKHAVLGAIRQDALRFGAFFGTFSFLWKFVNNGLKLYRGTDDRINGAIAGELKITKAKQQLRENIPIINDKYFADFQLTSGAIAGLSILIENHERRVTFAQQMFIRSMQGVYHAGKHRGQFSFRHGDALLFALASAQVMYAYTMYPDTIPKEFFGFMVKTARVPAESLAVNRNTVRGFPLDLKQVRALVERHRPTKMTIETVSNMSENVSVVPCAVLHPWIDSCQKNNIERFTQVTKEIFPVYATLNFVPLVVLRMKRLLKDPVNVMSKTTFNTLRSSIFLAIFVAGYQTQICTHRNLLKAGLPLGNSKYLYWLFGLVCAGTSIMVEQESRRAELAMYVLPKAAESIYKILYSKKLVKGIKHWEVMMFSFAMSIIMYTS